MQVLDSDSNHVQPICLATFVHCSTRWLCPAPPVQVLGNDFEYDAQLPRPSFKAFFYCCFSTVQVLDVDFEYVQPTGALLSRQGLLDWLTSQVRATCPKRAGFVPKVGLADVAGERRPAREVGGA